MFGFVGSGFGKERKLGEILNVFVSTWYHRPNVCIRRVEFVDGKGCLPTSPGPYY